MYTYLNASLTLKIPVHNARSKVSQEVDQNDIDIFAFDEQALTGV